MNKKLWFKAKNYGWGWYPATWEGWAIIIGYLILDFGTVYRIEHLVQSDSAFLFQFIPQIFLLTFLLIGICYITGEKPEWRWGGKKKK